MKLSINLDVKSINSAIKQIENIKKLYAYEIPNAFMRVCCEAIKDKANSYIDLLDISDDVKIDIQSKWTIENKTPYIIVLRNSSDKAAFVEFGVGSAGEGSYNPTKEGFEMPDNYKYNVDSRHKRYDMQADEFYWGFVENSLDEQRNIPIEDLAIHSRHGGVYMTTSGTKGAMFLYQAAIDFATSNQPKEIYQRIKAQYIG